MKTSIMKRIEKWVEESDKKDLKKKISLENLDDSNLKLLSIPVFGGIMYIVSQVKRGYHVKNIINSKASELEKIKNALKNENSKKKSIRKTLELLEETERYVELSVPPDSLTEFLEVLEEFPSIKAVQDNGSDYDYRIFIRNEVIDI